MSTVRNTTAGIVSFRPFTSVVLLGLALDRISMLTRWLAGTPASFDWCVR